MKSFNTYRDSVFLNQIIQHPLVKIGDYTYYSGYYSTQSGDVMKELIHYLDKQDTDESKLIIGKFCQIASGVSFLMGGNNSHRHDWVTAYNLGNLAPDNTDLQQNKMPKSYQTRGDTVVGNDVWIGEGATIMPGIQIGDGAVIAARSVVTKDVKPYEIVGGNPAVSKGMRFTAEQIKQLQQLRWWDWDIEKIVANTPLLQTGDIRDLSKLTANSQSNNGSNYKTILKNLKQNHFLSTNGKNDSHLTGAIHSTLKKVRHAQGSGPVYTKAGDAFSEKDILNAQVPDDPHPNIEKLLSDGIPRHLQDSIIAGHPLQLKNIIPLPHIAYIAANAVVSSFMPNGVTGADAGHTLTAERQCAVALSKMAGYNSEASGGVFTFGGTGTNLYGIKMGLSKVAPKSNQKGMPNDIVVLGAVPGHYSHRSAIAWAGIGEENFITVKSNADQTTNLDSLKQNLELALDKGKKVACIILSGGTTSCMGIDDFLEVRKLVDGVVKKYKLTYRPHIHADAVLGWAYLNFVDYDFDKNPLQFSSAILEKIKTITERVATLQYADSFGVDFHKTGYTPYTSSMIIAKDAQDLIGLSRSPESVTPLFHEGSSYEPGKFTFETSRSAASMVGTWYTLQALGKNGYRALLGHAQIVSEKLKDRFAAEKEIAVVNRGTFGSDVFLRLYPHGVDAEEMFVQERTDSALLKKQTAYTDAFFKWLQENNYNGSKGFALSKSSAAFYTEKGAPVPAIRLYILNPYITEQDIAEIHTKLCNYKKEYDRNLSLVVQPNGTVTNAMKAAAVSNDNTLGRK